VKSLTSRVKVQVLTGSEGNEGDERPLGMLTGSKLAGSEVEDVGDERP
jgi:hypothetical protein